MQSGSLLPLALAALMASHTFVLVDWKSELARKAVGRAAQEGIEEALEEGLENVARDAAFEAASRDAAYDRRERIARPVDAERREAIGSTAGDAVEAAMKAADVASSMETALDAAEAARKIHKLHKAINRFID